MLPWPKRGFGCGHGWTGWQPPIHGTHCACASRVTASSTTRTSSLTAKPATWWRGRKPGWRCSLVDDDRAHSADRQLQVHNPSEWGGDADPVSLTGVDGWT
jgi:hypothetical protein